MSDILSQLNDRLLYSIDVCVTTYIPYTECIPDTLIEDIEGAFYLTTDAEKVYTYLTNIDYQTAPLIVVRGTEMVSIRKTVSCPCGDPTCGELHGEQPTLVVDYTRKANRVISDTPPMFTMYQINKGASLLYTMYHIELSWEELQQLHTPQAVPLVTDIKNQTQSSAPLTALVVPVKDSKHHECFKMCPFCDDIGNVAKFHSTRKYTDGTPVVSSYVTTHRTESKEAVATETVNIRVLTETSSNPTVSLSIVHWKQKHDTSPC